MADVSVVSLWLPTVLSGVALFFASFLSWMIVQLHKQDWIKMSCEDDFLDKLRELDVKPGSYMFPGYDTPEEMKSEEAAKKFEQGPVGVITVFPGMTMGRNLALTMVFFLVCSFCIGYLGTMAIGPASTRFDVFRFIATAGLLTFLSAIVQHAIWFRSRVTGHVIESIAYALIIGAIFAALWPVK